MAIVLVEFLSVKFQSKCKVSSSIRRSFVSSDLVLFSELRFCCRCFRTHASRGGFELDFNSSEPVLAKCA